MCCVYMCFFFFKQKTAYEMRISDWSSDVCSSDLRRVQGVAASTEGGPAPARGLSACARYRCFVALTVALVPGAPTSQPPRTQRVEGEIGRASCRERVCQYV